DVGGVQLVLNKTSVSGFLRWDPKRIFAATIDGQHRLASLRSFFNSGNLTSKALDTKISVLFLVLDPRAGFRIAADHVSGGENSILTVVRE
ncbi:hypothetical protein, partial [Heyndrickxia sporothermodurans]